MPGEVIWLPSWMADGSRDSCATRLEHSRRAASALTRADRATANLNRARVTRGLGKAGLFKSWDEYPFASSVQGGNPILTRVVPVPALENQIQGGMILACYAIQKIQVAENFMVVVLP